MFGSFLGFVYGALNTTDAIIAGNQKIKIKIKLWANAVFHELFDESLDRETLYKIKLKYS
jgi:hypothetical protein